jgi:hypothetical protein
MIIYPKKFNFDKSNIQLQLKNAASWSLLLAIGLMAISKELLERDIWNFV